MVLEGLPCPRCRLLRFSCSPPLLFRGLLEPTVFFSRLPALPFDLLSLKALELSLTLQTLMLLPLSGLTAALSLLLTLLP